MPLSLLSPAAHVQSEPAFHCLVTFPDLLSPSPLLSQFLLLPRFAESRGPWTWAAISHWPAAQKKASPGLHTSGRNWTMSPSCPQLPHKVLILLIILLCPRWQPGLSLAWAARGGMAHWASAVICMVPLLERRFLKPKVDWVPYRDHLNFHGFFWYRGMFPIEKQGLGWMEERERCCHTLACGWKFQLPTHLHFKPNERLTEWKLEKERQNHPRKIWPASHTDATVFQ